MEGGWPHESLRRVNVNGYTELLGTHTNFQELVTNLHRQIGAAVIAINV